MENFNARFTRDSEGTWLIAVESAEAANQTMMVTRKNRNPVRMRTGAKIGPHPKWAGWYCYERLSKAPTSGRMGENDDSDGKPQGSAGQGQGQGQGQGEGQGQGQGNAPQDMSEYVTRPEWMEGRQSDLETLRAEIEGSRPIVVQGLPQGEVQVPAGTHHKALPDVMANVLAGIHTYLVGPAGTGKTTLAVGVAEALDRQLDICGAMLTKHEVIGYCDANGRYVRTAMRDAFEYGHLINWDEVDASSPAALVAVNAMLANDRYTFPDGTIERHPDFCVIACGNTYGTGADREYVGRLQLDAATLDRFAFIEVNYDESLELELGLAHYRANHPEADPACDTAYAWISEVQQARANVAERKLRHVVSPRATINGCKLLARGVDADKVRTMVLHKGASEDVLAALSVA